MRFELPVSWHLLFLACDYQIAYLATASIKHISRPQPQSREQKILFMARSDFV
jgi:hypothetical protein